MTLTEIYLIVSTALLLAFHCIVSANRQWLTLLLKGLTFATAVVGAFLTLVHYAPALGI